jgi:hypothetical protein
MSVHERMFLQLERRQPRRPRKNLHLCVVNRRMQADRIGQFCAAARRAFPALATLIMAARLNPRGGKASFPSP